MTREKVLLIQKTFLAQLKLALQQNKYCEILDSEDRTTDAQEVNP